MTRRKFSDARKRKILEHAAKTSPAEAAAQARINPSLISKWRHRLGALSNGKTNGKSHGNGETNGRSTLITVADAIDHLIQKRQREIEALDQVKKLLSH